MTPIDALIRDLRRLQTCFQIECGYPRSDAKSYDFALGQDIKKALLALQEKVEEQKSVDPLLAQVARDFLADPDGHVKEAALHLLATQPTSAESLETILVHVIAEYDSELIEQALLELGRYQNVHEVERINEALAQAMTHGAPFVSQKIAENIEPFIQDQSYAFFATLSRRLTNGSQTYKQLHSALESFSRRQTGG